MIGAPSSPAKGYWGHLTSLRAETKRLALGVLVALLLHLLALSLIEAPHKSRPAQPPPLSLRWSHAASGVGDTHSGREYDEASSRTTSRRYAPLPATTRPAAVTVGKTPANAATKNDIVLHPPPPAPVETSESAPGLVREPAADTPPGGQYTNHSAHVARIGHPRLPANPKPAAVTADETSANTGSGSDTIAPSPPTSAELIESARRLARSVGREQERSTPANHALRERAVLPALERALAKHPASETRLGNGQIKITTASGTTYCLRQPPPDLAPGGLVEPMAVPSTCP